MMGVSVVAAFVWPPLFVGGACAASVPVIIHLLARRRFKRIRWAAVAFLLQAERRNRRRIRLEDVILMLLRCLAVLLLGMLVARPFFRPAGLAALLGGSDRTERIFVLDDSFSMGYAVGDETVFDRAKRGVVRIVELLRDQSPHDTVTVLRTSSMERPVTAGIFLDERQTTDLFSRIHALAVSQHGLSARDVFQSLRGLIDEQSETVNVAVYVLSDFQRKDWVRSGVESGQSKDDTERHEGTESRSHGGSRAGHLGASAGGASPIAPLATSEGVDRGIELILVDVGPDAAANLAVTAVTSERSRFVAAVNGPIDVTVANFSDRSIEAVDLEVAVGPSVQPTVTVDHLPAGESAEVPVSVAFPRPGWNWVRVSMEGDGLAIDDQRTMAIETVEAVRVLIVNGEPSSDAYRDEVTLLVTALRPPGEVFSGNEVSVIDETELDDADLERFDVVLLANVYRVSESAAGKLGAFTATGGGVAFMLGDQIDADFYNETLYRDGRGILPARLGDRRAPPSGARLVAGDALHPMVRILAGRENPFAKQIHFTQYFSCTIPSVEDRATSASATTPTGAGLDDRTTPVGRSVTVAHFDDAVGSPAVVERAYGAGRVVMFTSGCDLEWNDWAKDPSYVVAMLELVHHLSRGRATSDVVVGAPIEFSIDPATYDPDILVRTPAYPAEREVALTAVPAEDGRGFRVRWDETHRRGVYQFLLNRQTGEEEVRAVAVNLDPSESDLAFAAESDLSRSLTEMPFTYVDGLKSLNVVGEEARRELWKTILVAVVAVLMGEQLLGWWFGRRE